MSTDHPRQVLLVEDQSEVSTTLLRRLAAEDYQPTLATNYADARQLLETSHFHAAIFDLRLDEADEGNEDGLRLLADVTAFGLQGLMPCLVLTAYPNMERILKALQDHRAARFIQKQPGYITELLEALRRLFKEDLKIGFQIEYEGDSLERIDQCARHIREPEQADWPAPEQLTPQVHDLLGKLFPDAHRLWVKKLVTGLSGSAVLHVHPTWADGIGKALIVKVGRRDKTQVEQTNYDHYVERYLPDHHSTRLAAQFTRHLGALAYTLMDVDSDEITEFEEFYTQRPAAETVRVLQQLFRETCRPWYFKSRALPAHVSLRDLYFEAFNLAGQPDRLHREARSVRPDLDAQSPEIAFDEPAVSLPNPLRWLDSRELSMLPVCHAITHGDLNTRNILMNAEGQCWLIDFYRTYPSHILRDFVVLETDIKFRLTPALSPQAFYDLEAALLGLKHPADGAALGAGLGPGAEKAAAVIAGLRAEAWALLAGEAPRQIRREYLVSLLMATLNILRLRQYKTNVALQPRRSLALLSAALIAQHLEHPAL